MRFLHEYMDFQPEYSSEIHLFIIIKRAHQISPRLFLLLFCPPRLCRKSEKLRGRTCYPTFSSTFLLFFFLSPIFFFHGWWFCFSFEFYSFRVIRTKFAALLLSEEVGLISPFLETRHIRFEATIASRKRLLLVSLKIGFMEIDQIC